MQNRDIFKGFTVYLNASAVPNDSIITGGEAAPAPAEGTTATAAADPNAAAPQAADPMGGMWIWIIYIPLLIGLYFLMTRPQRKREKQQREMQAALRVGDEVVTAGGFFGRIADVGEDSFMVEFGRNRSIHIVLKYMHVS